MDLICILATAPFWLPLMGLIAIAIKIVSPGPVLFRQVRIGYLGERFVCLKFRSMKVHASTEGHEKYMQELIRSDCPMTKLDDHDARLIPFGKVFRASGLDELPQILNVLRGEMSLVGPRPCTTEEFEMYQPWQRERASAPPGLTGYWQVHGKNKTTFTEMISMDIRYCRTMTLREDIAIILRTVPVMIGEALRPIRSSAKIINH